MNSRKVSLVINLWPVEDQVVRESQWFVGQIHLSCSTKKMLNKSSSLPAKPHDLFPKEMIFATYLHFFTVPILTRFWDTTKRQATHPRLARRRWWPKSRENRLGSTVEVEQNDEKGMMTWWSNMIITMIEDVHVVSRFWWVAVPRFLGHALPCLEARTVLLSPTTAVGQNGRHQHLNLCRSIWKWSADKWRQLWIQCKRPCCCGYVSAAKKHMFFELKSLGNLREKSLLFWSVD